MHQVSHSSLPSIRSSIYIPLQFNLSFQETQRCCTFFRLMQFFSAIYVHIYVHTYIYIHIYMHAYAYMCMYLSGTDVSVRYWTQRQTEINWLLLHQGECCNGFQQKETPTILINNHLQNGSWEQGFATSLLYAFESAVCCFSSLPPLPNASVASIEWEQDDDHAWRWYWHILSSMLPTNLQQKGPSP